VKGIQSLEDVQLCVEHGVEGVIIVSWIPRYLFDFGVTYVPTKYIVTDLLFIQSNHGGRQADYAPAPIDVLYEIRSLRPDLFSKTEIMIDGGIRCGADVVKALALGAKAVGLGRPFLYANGTHGEEGCSRVIESKIFLFRAPVVETDSFPSFT
jgi:L-lactate dehydrogenase (cytochrome)